MSFLSIFFSGIPCRHWKIAECSLSTGRSFTPFFFTASHTSLPPVTSVSLFAKAISFLAFAAASVGFKPTIPTTEFTTRSAFSSVAASISPSIPLKTRVFVSFILSLNSLAFSSLKTTASSGLYFLTCSSSSFIFVDAVSAETFKLSLSATSSVWVPIEPVDPRIESEFTILVYPTVMKGMN